MDIKSKKSNSGLAGRLIAFILVAALSASSASAVIFAGANLLHMQEEYVATRVSAADILLDRVYFDSDFFKGRINSDTAHLTQLYSEFGGIDPRDPDYRMESDANAVREFNDTERHIYSEIAEMIEDSMSFYAPEDFDEESINDVVSDAASDSGSSDEAASGEDSQTKTADNSRKNEAIFYQGEPGYEWAMSDNRRISFDIGPMFFDEDLVREKHSNDGYGVNVMFKVSNFDAPGVKKIFEKHYEKNLEDLRAEFVSEKKRRYDEVEKLLDAGGASYYIGGGSGSIANVRLNESGYPADLAVFVSAPAYRTYKDGEMKEHPKTVGYFSDTLPFGYFSDALPSGTSMYISYDKAAVAAATEQLTETKWVRPYFIFAALALALALILLIFLIVVTGRKRADGSRRLYKLDKVFTEAQLGIIILVLIFAARIFEIRFDCDALLGFNDNTVLLRFATLTGVQFVCASLFFWCFLSLIRNLKAGSFLKQSIIWILVSRLFRATNTLFRIVKSGFDRKNPFAKTIILVAALFAFSAVAGMICILFFGNFYLGVLTLVPFVPLVCVFAIAMLFTKQRVVKYDKLRQGIEQIAGGNLQWRIPVGVAETSEFDHLARRVNEIGNATDIAVQNELKNQRLKTDLISNVSHDLKTPLTSILTYTDLLKKEGLRSKNAPSYLEIIDEKGKRLQKLTEDLFDAAKASSGAISVRREKLDLLSLLNQEIAEMADSLALLELEIIINGSRRDADESVDAKPPMDDDKNFLETSTKSEAAETRCYVLADSRLLWRVVDNLLSNVRKYALPGSRVYIDIREQSTTENDANAKNATHGMTVMEMKNISKAKLNIPADELMERFKRGDESRTTEGSGLGLAIANDLVRLQGGRFEISIDGDLFKTITMLEPWR